MIKENLREICIYETIGDLRDEADDHLWFNYLYNTHFQCLGHFGKIEDQCAERMMRDLDIDVEKVNECIEGSFAQEGNWQSYNNLLSADREHATDLGIQYNPAVAINSLPYHGEIKAKEIFAQICSSYRAKHAPEVCSPDYDIQLSLGHMDDFVQPQFVRMHLVFAIGLVIIFNGLLACWCINRKKQQQRDQVQVQVEKYFKLESSDTSL